MNTAATSAAATTEKKPRKAREKTLNKVVAYQSTDGQLFTDKTAYLQHQAALTYGANVKALVEDKISDVDYAVEDFNGAVVLDKGQIAEWLLDNRASVLAALNGKYVTTDETKAA